MILCYHKIDPVPKTQWWISVDTFYKQMVALQGYTVVPLDEYDPGNPKHCVITFDGIYENVYKYAVPIMEKWGYPFELFVIGNTIGKDNSFDTCEPFAKFANFEQLADCEKRGGRIQWHSLTHCDFSNLSTEDLKKEIIPDYDIVKKFSCNSMKWFAYPHARYNEDAEILVKEYFSGALLCENGESLDKFNFKRTTVSEKTNLFKNKVSLIIANFNYGAYLIDAVDSVLAQTVPPDEFVIIDDASTDNSKEIMKLYEDKATLIYNDINLGVVDNFRKAVEATSGEYICFLGADNRMRCDYLELCRSALDANENAAIAYTDILLFGEMASVFYEETKDKYDIEKIVTSKTVNQNLYIWRFPEATEENIKNIRYNNFIHGSSMYRREDYNRVGGYMKTKMAEDHNLFSRILKNGCNAVHIAQPILEYRQHSPQQANNVLIHQMREAKFFDELTKYRRQSYVLSKKNEKLFEAVNNSQQLIEHLQKELAQRDRNIKLLREIIERKNNNKS